MDEKEVRERSLLDQQEMLRKESFKLEIAVPLPYNVLVNFSFYDIVLLKTKHCKLMYPFVFLQCTKQTVEQSHLECPEADKTITEIWSTNSEPRKQSPRSLLIPLQKASSQVIFFCLNREVHMSM